MRHCFAIFAIALAAVVAAPSVAAQSDLSDQRSVRCESSDGREHHCAADTSGGARVLRQLSRSACTRGRSWGIDRSGVWVSQGCRAEFGVGGGGGEYVDRGNRGRVVRCESDSGRSNLCVMNTRHGVELVRQLSRSACMRDQSWGWNERGVWVSGGCRADFRMRGGSRRDDRDRDADHDRGPVEAIQSVHCESVDGAKRHCAANTAGGVRLSRQVSRTPCVESRNWGVDRHGVWVSDGCRAEFEASAQPRLGGR